MNIKEIREQIQEDMIAYCEAKLPLDYKESQSMTDDLCQIVVDNFKKLDDKPNESVERHQATQRFFNDTYNTEGY